MGKMMLPEERCLREAENARAVVEGELIEPMRELILCESEVESDLEVESESGTEPESKVEVEVQPNPPRDGIDYLVDKEMNSMQPEDDAMVDDQGDLTLSSRRLEPLGSTRYQSELYETVDANEFAYIQLTGINQSQAHLRDDKNEIRVRAWIYDYYDRERELPAEKDAPRTIKRLLSRCTLTFEALSAQVKTLDEGEVMET